MQKRQSSDKHEEDKAQPEAKDIVHRLIDQMPSAYALHEILCDEQGHPVDYRFLDVNPAFEQMTGLKADSLVGHTVLEVMPQTELSWIERFGQVALTGEPIHFEDFSQQFNRYIEGMAFRPAPNQFACSLTDITERKNTEKALRESQEHFAAFFRQAPLGYQSLDVDGRFIEVNEAWLATLGYSEDEVIGKWFGDFLAPEYTDAFRQRFPIFKAEGKIHSEFEMLHKNGERRFIGFEGRIRHGRDGRFERTHCILQDITESRRADLALVAAKEQIEISAEYLENILNNIGDPVFVKDDQSRILLANDAFCTIFGLEREQILGKTLAEDVPPDERESFLSTDRQVIADGRESIVEERLTVRGGQTRTISTRKSRFVDSSGNRFLVGIIRDLTERKQAEDEVRQSNELLSLFVLNSPIYAFIKEVSPTESRVLMASENYQDMIGIPGSEMAGKRMEELFPADLAAKFTADDWAVVSSGKILQVDEALGGRSYTTVKFPIFLGGKNLLAGYTIDITERKRAEDALRQRTQLLEASQSIARVGGWELDIATGELFWTAETYRIHDTSPAEFSPTVDAGVSYFLPESRRIISDALQAAMERGEGYDLELETLTTKGRRIDVRTTCEVTMVKGRPAQLTGIFQDITEQKQAELALAAEKERLAVTLRSIGDGVITTDTNGAIVMLNKVAEAMTGWKAVEAAGRPLLEVFNIINERTRQKCQNPVERVLATGGIVELANHTCLIAKDGREIVIADSGAPIYDNQSQIIGVVLVFRDMTEKQRLEDFMQKSQKLESLGVLAGGIAHDFNNLLGAIFGYTELAMAKATNAEVATYLAKSVNTIDRARALTQQLLTFAKGGVPIRKVENLFPFVQETAQFALSGSSVSSRFQIQEGLWPCDFDRNQIGQVIDNLTINAQQAMPTGGTIEISARNISLAPGEHISLAAGNYVKLSIKDQGIGIPKEFLPRIFDPYYTTKTKGHGLGLATCYSIIARHDGCIDVESEPGKGSTFHVYLPASIDSTSSLAGKPAEEHTGNGTFLIMDDDKVIGEVMKEILESFGYTVMLTTNGEEAVDFCMAETQANRPLAGMIFDLTIPGGMGGKEAIIEIRKICPDTPAFVASGYSVDPIMANPQAYGFTASLPKPFTIDELMDVLEKHVTKAA